MAWLWETWEEFENAVHPTEERIGAFLQSKRETQFESVRSLVQALTTLREAAGNLHTLGFERHKGPPKDPSISEEARQFVVEAIYSGEGLLLYHKRLALSEAAYGFLHQNDLLAHWERYAKTERIATEIQQLYTDILELLEGYDQLARADERFITDDVDLPESLEPDFRLSRDLFSVGFDEVGLFVAGRGLEGVLRQIARDQKIHFERGKKLTQACEADFYDLIEIMSKVRWKVQNVPLISREAKSLLQFLRTTRNSGAHPGNHNGEVSSARETAAVVAKTATHLWKSASTSRARVDPTTVQKDW